MAQEALLSDNNHSKERCRGEQLIENLGNDANLVPFAQQGHAKSKLLRLSGVIDKRLTYQPEDLDNNDSC